MTPLRLAYILETSFCRNIVSYRTRELLRKGFFPAMTKEDLAQEIHLHLVKNLPKFTTRRGRLRGFIVVLIKRFTRNLLRKAYAKKRQLRFDADPERICRSSQIDYDRRRSCSDRDAFEQSDLKLDLEQAHRLAGTATQELMRILRVQSINDSARTLQKPVSTIRRMISTMRKSFEAQGLRAYLN